MKINKIYKEFSIQIVILPNIVEFLRSRKCVENRNNSLLRLNTTCIRNFLAQIQYSRVKIHFGTQFSSILWVSPLPPPHSSGLKIKNWLSEKYRPYIYKNFKVKPSSRFKIYRTDSFYFILMLNYKSNFGCNSALPPSYFWPKI